MADDKARLARLRALASASGLPLTAAGNVHMHVRSRRRLQDALTAIRLGRQVSECGDALHPNGERHLRLRAGLLLEISDAGLVRVREHVGVVLEELFIGLAHRGRGFGTGRHHDVGLDGAVIGIDTFGESAPAGALFNHFGFTTDKVVAAVKSVLH